MIPFRQIVFNNLIQALNHRTLDNGFYMEVGLGQLDFDGNDLSLLQRKTGDPTFDDGQVYQSRFPEWVYESGVMPPSGMDVPTVASGVYIDSTFYPRDDATYGHLIDFRNGRIVFDDATAVASDSTVQAAFARKRVFIDRFGKRVQPMLNALSGYNPEFSQPTSLPFGYFLPAIIIEMDRKKMKPMQLGGGKKVFETINFHIMGDEDGDKDLLVDLISFLDERTLLFVDTRIAPFALDEQGDVTDDYTPYPSLQVDPEFFWHKCIFRDLQTREIATDNGLELAVVTLGVELWMSEA